MTLSKKQFDYIIEVYPNCHEDNTKFCVAVWETVAKTRGLAPTWENMTVIMQEYKPEAITRKRREYIKSTIHQKEKEYETWKEYKT